MSLNVQIIDLNQKVSFEDGSVSNFLTIELANGKRITVLATDGDAAMVVEAVQHAKKIFHPPAQEAPSRKAAAVVVSDDGVAEFGGDFKPPNGAASTPAIEDDDDAPAVPPQLPPTINSLRVAVNEAGYPMAADRGPAPDDNREIDEDGVRSV